MKNVIAVVCLFVLASAQAKADLPIPQGTRGQIVGLTTNQGRAFVLMIYYTPSVPPGYVAFWLEVKDQTSVYNILSQQSNFFQLPFSGFARVWYNNSPAAPAFKTASVIRVVP